jgi:hypothetical protein
MKHTLYHCRSMRPSHIIAAYFFNARGDPLEKTPLGMLRSLVLQLLGKEPSIYERFILTFGNKLQCIKQGSVRGRSRN